MNQQFASRVLADLAAKNEGNPEFDAFIADFNGRSGDEQKQIVGEIAAKMGAKFEPDVNPAELKEGQGGIAAALVQGAAKSATFGLANKAAGVISGVNQDQPISQTIGQFEAREQQIKAQNPIAYTIGRGLGYLANPVAGAIKAGAGIAGFAMQAAGQAAVVEGGIAAHENGQKWANGEIDTATFIKDTAGTAVKEGAFAGAAAGVLGGVAKGLFLGGKALVSKLAKARYDALAPEAKVIIDNLDEVAALPKAEAAKQYEAAGKQIMGYYNNLRTKIFKDLSNDIVQGGDDVIDLSKTFDEVINKQASEATEIIAGTRPGNIKQNLADTHDLLTYAYENISHNYGALIDDAVKGLPKAAQQADFSDAIGALKGAVMDETAGALAPKETALLQGMLKKLEGVKKLSFKTADQLRDAIDDVLPYGSKFTGPYAKLHEARTIISDRLKNPEVFGEAANTYAQIQKAYGATLRTKRTLLGAADVAMEATNDPVNLTSTLKKLQERLTKVAEPLETLQKAKLVQFSPGHQELFKKSVQAVKDTIQIDQMAKFKTAKSALQELIKTNGNVDSQVMSKYKELYTKLYGEDIFGRLAAYKQFHPSVGKALANPTSIPLREAALKYIDDVVPTAKPKFLETLNKAAHATRLGKNAIYTEVAPFVDDLVKGKIASIDELKSLSILADSVPELEQAFKKLNVAGARLGAKSVAETTLKKGIQDTEVAVGAAAAMNPSLGAKLGMLLGLVRNIADPTAVALKLTEMGLPTSQIPIVTKKLIKAGVLLNAAREGE